MKKLPLILFVYLSSFLKAQHDFRPGYIITNDNATIKGFIDNNPDQENAIQCNFKTDSLSSEIKTYTSGELKEYAFVDGKRYLSKNIKFSNTLSPYFLECISSGVISLYHLKNLGLFYYFVEKSNELYELRNDKISYVENGTNYTTTSGKYKGVLSMLMNDAPAISKDIEKTEFNRKALSKLMQNYHSQINKNDAFVLHNSDTKKNKAKWNIKYGAAIGLNYTYTKTSTYEDYEPFFEEYSMLSVEFAKIVNSNMPSVAGNPSNYHLFNLTPGLFVNLNNNSKNSVQLEVNVMNKKIKKNDFLLSSVTIITPVIYKREFKYYNKLKPFFDLGICFYYEGNIHTNMNITIDEPDQRDKNNNVVYERKSFDIDGKVSNIYKATEHWGFLGGFGYSYPLTKRNFLEFELRLNYTENRFNSYLGGVNIASRFQYINCGLITRISL